MARGEVVEHGSGGRQGKRGGSWGLYHAWVVCSSLRGLPSEFLLGFEPQPSCHFDDDEAPTVRYIQT